MKNDTLVRVAELLMKLDPEEFTLITYDPKRFTLECKQVGRVIDLSPLRGLINAQNFKQAILTPVGLSELLKNLNFIINYPDDLLFVPKKLGYIVMGRELKYYSKPRPIIGLQFYSVKNPFYLWIASLVSEKYRRILHL